MASTGEVACFGKDKYEAYLKALISTGFKVPRKNGNILLSVGSFKEKNEIAPSARKLSELGYKLFATPGTADFLIEQGIAVTFLDVFEGTSKDDLKKQEYSLTNALASKQVGKKERGRLFIFFYLMVLFFSIFFFQDRLVHQLALDEQLPSPRQLRLPWLPHAPHGC